MTNLKRLPVSMSVEGTRGTKTGRWGVMRPIFGEKSAPCRNSCPGSVDIPGFIDRVQNDDIEGAWRVIIENNPMPRITGRVCFHPCEGACNRKDYDEALSIHSLERFVGDRAFEKGFIHYPEPSLDNKNHKQIAVVGTGPAGLGCAFYLLRNGYRVCLFEAMPEIGGLLRYGIPEYRLPKKILSEELEMILGLGAEILEDTRVGVNVSWAEIAADFQGIFLGLGAQNPIRLGIAGEAQGGVIDGLAFLRTGLDAPPITPGQTVLIIGGGNTAIDAARSVLRLKANPLVLYRRTREEMPAFEDEIREAEEEGIEIRFLTSPKAIVRERGAVTGLECIKTRVIEAGVDDGRRRFAPIEGSEFFIRGDAVIAALGQQVGPADIPPEIMVADDAVVVVTGDGSCGPAGLYAGGDVTDLPRSVIHAVSSGRRAAEAMDVYLRGKERSGSEDLSCDRAASSPAALEEINLAYFKHAPREAPRVQDAEERISNLEEVTGTYTPDAAAREAGRCFSCGRCTACGNCYFFCPDLAVHRDSKTSTIVIDSEYCKGCCICVEECPRGVLSAEVKQ